MQTLKGSKVTFLFNVDYSGEVRMVVPDSAVEEELRSDGLGNDYRHVLVPFEDLRQFIAEYVRQALIARIEDATDSEILTKENI